VIRVDSDFVSGDFGNDTLAAATTQIYDLADNAAGTAAVAIQTINSAPSFTTAGTGDGITMWDGTNGDDAGYGVTILDDGRILVSGYTHNGSDSDFALWRYNADSTIDTSFGGGTGLVTTDFGGNEDLGFNVAVQTDGKIVVSGESNDDFAVVRYNSDGSLDTGFGTGGKVTTHLYGVESVERMVIQADGKILVSGYTDPGPGGVKDWALVRYNTDGSLDTSFDDGQDAAGVVTADWGGSSGQDLAREILLQADGKILVSGRGPTAEAGGTDSSFNIARYNSNGTLDTSFGGGNGFAALDVGSNHDQAYGIALQDDGKILQTGLDNDTNNMIVVRWNSDGTVDTGFDGDGIVLIDAGTNSLTGRDIHIQDDGKLLITGYSQNGSDYDLAIVRLNADGSLDTSFDTDGIVITPVLSNHDLALCSTVTPDGRILVVGYTDNGTDNDLLIARYNSDGSLDTGFDGTNTLDGTPTFTSGGPAVVLDADVNIRDAELDSLNTGSGNYDGASVTLVRNGGADSDDAFSFNDGNGITLSGGNLIKNSQIVASFDTTTTAGELVITFTDTNGEIPTSADVDNILRQITYSNGAGSPPASVQIDWTFDDGNTGTQGAGGALQR